MLSKIVLAAHHIKNNGGGCNRLLPQGSVVRRLRASLLTSVSDISFVCFTTLKLEALPCSH